MNQTLEDSKCIVEVRSPRKIDAVSPFRYPGGKGFLRPFLEDEVSSLGGDTRHYVEPFAGGAGAALAMLRSGAVQMLHLNDLDVSVYSAWRAMLSETDRFLDRLRSVEVGPETWNWAREKLQVATEYSFDLGFAAFFVNRTSRAGIMQGSGPIGGYRQDGRWKMDARFYRDTLISRVSWLGSNASRISLTCENGVSFLRRLQASLPHDSTYYFIDPPYVRAGARLYLNAMAEHDHRELAALVAAFKTPHWSITYDDDPLVWQLYPQQQVRKLSVAYSLGRTRKEQELLITPHAAARKLDGDQTLFGSQ